MSKKKIRSIALGIAAIICVASMAIGAVNLHTAKAAVTEQTVYADDFNTAVLSDMWTAKVASVVSEYSSLRVQPTEYSWPAHILCQAYKLSGDCRLEVKTQRLPSDGEAWYALSFGSPSATTSIFEKASGALIFSNGITQLFKSGANTQRTFAYSPFDIDIASIVLEFSKRESGTYDIKYTVKDGDLLIGEATIEDFEVQDGYFGFNSYGVDFDVLSFDVYEGTEKVYADDFSTSKMSYNNNVIKNSEWVALTPFEEETASIAPVGQLDVSKVGASVVYNQAFEKKSAEVSTLYEMSATFDFSGATVGTATGFEVAKSSVETSGVFVGITRGFTGYELVIFDGESTDQKSLESNPADGIFNINVAARYDNTLIVTVNEQTESFSVSATEGYWGITCSEKYASSGKGALVDDFSFQRSIYAENSVSDMAYFIDTLGYVPNANTLTDRSQPPLFCSAVYDYYVHKGDKAIIEKYMPYILKEYEFWQTQRKAKFGLNNFSTNADEELKMLNYIYLSERVLEKRETREEQLALAEDIMAIAESGLDFNMRFRTSRSKVDASAFLHLDLNCFLYEMECKTAEMLKVIGGDYASFEQNAAKRKELIEKYFFDKETGLYLDCNLVDGGYSEIVSAISTYPYAYGISNDAEGLKKVIAGLEYEKGITVTPYRGEDVYFQWDYPCMWPAATCSMYKALKRLGLYEDAKRIAKKYMRVMDENFIKTGRLWEKYDAVTGGIGQSAEYDTPEMMGWTAGVYVYFDEELKNI